VLGEHGRWLDDAGFVGACVEPGEDAGGSVRVAWERVGTFLERREMLEVDREVLRLAVELATEDDARRLYESRIFEPELELRIGLYRAIVRCR
jgi:hypothetical protein